MNTLNQKLNEILGESMVRILKQVLTFAFIFLAICFVCHSFV